MRRTRRSWFIALVAVAAVSAAPLGWAAFGPLRAASRDVLFDIPKGTWARRMAGENIDILPARVTLTLGLRDVLLLRNSDTVPQMFGPVLIMPGQDFRLPFSEVSENQFDCTAHASGQMTVIVEPLPAPGWARLKWRLAAAWRSVFTS